MRMGAAILLLAGAAAWARGEQPLAFEVASVKPNRTEGYPRTYPRLQNGTFSAEIASLKTLVVIAYGLTEQRIDGPKWLDTERYDITAKAPDGVPDSPIKPLLQSLLKDRFHLESHFETKEMAAYDMVVGKRGAKLRPFDPAQPPETPRNYGQAVMLGIGTTGEIADALARAVGRPIVDKTGMQGRFGWTVNYTPFSANGSSGDSAPPDLFAAIEQQLGLKLEPKKESLQILVIDHAERVPTEN